VAERHAQGRPAKPAMGAALQPCTYHNGSDQEVDVLGARWVSMAEGADTHHRPAYP